MTSASAAVVAPDDAVTSQRVASRLREEILAGRLAPGDRLRQDEIAARLGSSRLPVREALRILESEGLVELEPHKGARVPELSLDEVDTLYRMRERLEPLTLVESMQHLTGEQVAHMERVQEQIEENSDIARFLLLDREFHMSSYAACPSQPLLAMTTRLWNSTQHYRRAFMLLAGSDRSAVVNAEHRLLLDAVRRRDPEDAERFLVGHIRRTRVELTQHPEIVVPR
ncbi:MAG TPA: GntR family transcriptional regulator [Candidatus Nanopelagicales bacterium]|nr:GntR family transcriptional regulator [Candidatus Nanopelagicales bacterium]